MRKTSLLLALAFAGAAWGQTGELWFNYGESLLSSAGIGTPEAFGGTSNDVKLDNGYRFSLRFGFNQGSHFGHEVQYAFNHTQFDESAIATIPAGSSTGTLGTTANVPAKQAMHFHQGGYNFLY